MKKSLISLLLVGTLMAPTVVGATGTGLLPELENKGTAEEYYDQTHEGVTTRFYTGGDGSFDSGVDVAEIIVVEIVVPTDVVLVAGETLDYKALLDLPESAVVEEIVAPDQGVIATFAKVLVTFVNGVEEEVTIPVTVEAPSEIPATPVTPIPEVVVPTDTVLVRGETLNYYEVLDVPEGTVIEELTAPVQEVTATFAELLVTFPDGSSRKINLPVTVEDLSIPVTPITPIPEVEVPVDTQLVLGATLDYTQVLDLPEGATVEELEGPDHSVTATFARLRVTFADGSSRVIVLPVTIVNPVTDSYVNVIFMEGDNAYAGQLVELYIEGNYVGDLTTDADGLVRVDTVEGTTYALHVPEYDQTVDFVGAAEASTKFVDLGIPATPITPIPEVEVPNDTKLVRGGALDYAAILDLPEGATVEELEGPDHSVTATFARLRVTFADGSSRVILLPVTMVDPESEESSEEESSKEESSEEGSRSESKEESREEASKKDESKDTLPATGENSTYLFVALAAIFLLAGGALIFKNRRKA